MQQIHSFAKAEQKTLADIRRCLDSVRQIVEQDVRSISDGIDLLSRLRQVAYENIN
jgi:hypothetical protein